MTEVIVLRVDISGIPRTGKPHYVEAGWQGKSPAIPLMPSYGQIGPVALTTASRPSNAPRSASRIIGTILSLELRWIAPGPRVA